MRNFSSELKKIIEGLKTEVYVGKKKESNLKLITWMSVLVIVIATVIGVLNLVQKSYFAAGVSLYFIVAFMISAYFAGVKKNREIPKYTLMVEGIIIFTAMAISGVNNGFIILWVTLFPMIYMYFIDVRWGIFVSLYFEILFCIMFYSPLKHAMAANYDEKFMDRFPMFYLAVFMISVVEMIPHHLNILRNNQQEEILKKAILDERKRCLDVEWEKRKVQFEVETKNKLFEEMSHKIRTPINGIFGMNELILHDTTDEAILEKSRNIDKTCRELLDLIDYLLGISGAKKADEPYETRIREISQDNITRYIEADFSLLKILCVDDNKINRMVIEGYLNRTGCELEFANDGKEAVEKSVTKKYDIILMDHIMPVMDGIEALHAIRDNQDNPNKDTIVVALTANAINGAWEKYDAEGFDDYMSKPVIYHEFIRLISNYQKDLKGKEGLINIPVEEKLIDTKAGLLNCINDKDFYLEILRDFLKQGREDIGKLKELKDKNYIEEYHVLVHALKNTSMTIGAEKLSEKSKEHEFAAKDNNQSFIEKDFEQFTELYSKVLEETEKLIEEYSH